VAAERRGDYDAAEENFQKQSGPYGSVHLARILSKKGKPKEAAQLLDQVTQFVHDQLEQGADAPANREILARIHALKGNKEEAYRWLQEEFNIGLPDHSVAYNPAWDNLRGEPRFRKIIAKVNAEKEVMLRRVQEMEKEWE
jgi:ATP/maltotriose-dependent transcriptional regulator MalT